MNVISNDKPLAIFQGCVAGLIVLLFAAYGNHFRDGFHFDDSHAIVQNPSLRDLKLVPRYFVDATTFSVLPLNQSYRPVLQATLAIDYRIGGGLDARVFQISTFAWYLGQLALMFALFVAVANRAAPGDASNRWLALLAVAIYALHPVCAETVNYVIQRGEILSTVGVVAGLVLYVRSPQLRRWGVYLIPIAIGALAKQTALIAPALLLVYARLFEDDGWGRAFRKAAPSIALAIVLAWWTANRTPPTWVAGGGPAWQYWLTQTFVTLRYAGAFFAPIDLSADNDWPLLGGLADPRAAIGVLFVAVLAWAGVRAARRIDTRPIAFGLWWFLIALLPTAVIPLAEVANDHRMFLPFVGLALAVVWTARTAMRRVPALAARRVTAAGLVVLVLAAEAVGVHARNEVWRTDESLWSDVVRKSPTNGRGLMNYGLSLMEKGDYLGALGSFERALVFSPAYSLLHVNLGIAYGGVGRVADAQRAFLAAIALAPADWRSHYYYGRWLRAVGRLPDALAQLQLAAAENPADLDARELLQAIATGQPLTPESHLELSLARYQAGDFRGCIASALDALTLRPDYAEAYNNVAAGHNALGEWDAGIAAAEQAVRLKPDFALARNNLAYALAHKQRTAK